ncbi:hypothetical protein M8445_17520 (plasmid) [Deinococcus aquaticus]|uniref:Uncharacterized protein n=2 Tax=Deinococcus aquaticus TaxID=328692 RepID=A0ABY7V5T4_9DEIO|nr:hypothetical protein [Deinococcus aquaticus]WDA60537.1 hypothetical protein M8445_17520 [Deinococcus aquaticus]
MTVLRDRWGGCEKILTPVGPRSIGGDERCFLAGERKSAAVIPVYADMEVSAPDDINRIVDDTLREAGVLDLTSERQLRVMERLETTVTLSRPLPVLRVVNRSPCTVEEVTLRIRWRGEDLGESKYRTGSLDPGEEMQDSVPLRIFPTQPHISMSSVLFHDDGNWMDSACAARR